MTTPKIPSLAELNQLSASQAALLMLRVLNTSDLTFMYSLFKPETIKDIDNVCAGLLDMEWCDIPSEPRHTLSPDEISEFLDYLQSMNESISIAIPNTSTEV